MPVSGNDAADTTMIEQKHPNIILFSFRRTRLNTVYYQLIILLIGIYMSDYFVFLLPGFEIAS